MQSQSQIRLGITTTIVEALNTGRPPPWRQPWTNDPNCGSGADVVSRKNYRGINPMLVAIVAACEALEVLKRWFREQE